MNVSPRDLRRSIPFTPLALIAAALMTACGSETPGGGSADAGSSGDATVNADAAPGTDAASEDAASPTDGSSPRDASSPLDAGSPTDASSPMDAATNPDAGAMSMRYQPLAIGASWTYHVVDPSIGASGEQTNTVEAYEDVGGLKAGTMAFRLHKTKISGGTSDSWYEDLGTMVVIHHDVNRRADNSLSDEEWYAPNRIRVDETAAHTAMNANWTENIRKTNIDAVNGTVISNERAIWTVEAAAEVVTVPAGTFTCLRVRRDAGQTPKTYWFARGVGKVKESGGQEEELVRYNIP